MVVDKVFFQHDMASGDFKYLTRRTASDKILRDKAFNIAKYPKYDGYQRVLLQWFINFLIKKLQVKKQKLAEELDKPTIRKFKKRKVHSSFIDNIWGADLADMQFNRGFRFLLGVIDIFSKYAWVIPLKVKKGITITNAFQKVLEESNRKPNKIWVDKGSEFYSRSMKSWLKKMA